MKIFKNSNKKRKNVPNWLYVVIIVYVLLLTFLSYARYISLAESFDLKENGRILFLTLEGNFLFHDAGQLGYTGSSWGLHFSLLWLFVLPFYYIFSNVWILLLLQSFGFAIAIIPLYLFIKKKLNNELAAKLFSLVYLIFPTIFLTNVTEFTFRAFAIPLLFFVVFYLEKQDWKKYFLLLVLFMSIMEDLSLIVFFLGLFVLFGKNKKQGLKTIILGLSWFILTTNFLIPFFAFNNDPSINSYLFYQKYAYLGTTPKEIINSLITQPKILASAFNMYDLQYLYLLLVPFLFLPFASFFIIVTIPVLLQNILSPYIGVLCYNEYHNIILIPLLIISSVYGLQNLQRIISKNIIKKVVFLFLFTNIIFAIIFGVLPLILSNEWSNNVLIKNNFCFDDSFKLSEISRIKTAYVEYKQTKNIMKNIPNYESVKMSYRVASHITERRNLFFIQSRPDTWIENYIIIDKRDIKPEDEKEKILKKLQESYNISWHGSNVYVFKKV